MKKSRGFTLVELIVTVAILGLVFSMIYALVVSTVDAANKIEETHILADVGPAIISIMMRDFESAFLPNPDEEYFVGQDKYGYGGSGDRVDFISSNISFGEETDIGEQNFSVPNEIGYLTSSNPEDSNFMILYKREDLFMDEEPLKGGRLLKLYHRVKSFNVTYFNGEEWKTEWNNKKDGGMPKAVRIELVLALPYKSAEGGYLERTYITTIVYE